MKTADRATRADKWKLLARVAISAIVLVAVLRFVGDHAVFDRFSAMHPGYLALAVAATAGVVFFNSSRWQVLLRGRAVPFGFLDALMLYEVGLFFTLFLPGSMGGDAVRAYYVARKHGRSGAVLLATIQERVISLGSLLLVGGGATFVAYPLLGPALGWTLIVAHLAMLAAIAVVLFPAPLFGLARRVWWRVRSFGPAASLAAHPRAVRLRGALHSAMEPLRLDPSAILLLTVSMACAVACGLGTYWALALALNMHVPWLALFVAVPAVTLVRALPVSLNGIGVGEAALVVLLRPFDVPSDVAVALSLAGFAVQTLAGLVGGLCFLWVLNGRAHAHARAGAE